MRVGLLGTGHVGLPTAAALAQLGHEVHATDADAQRIEQLRKGSVPFFEPGLETLVEEGLAAGRLDFTASLVKAVKGSRVVFICVGTPPRADGNANLVAVEQAAEAVARHASGDLVLVEKSTVPAGTAERLAQLLVRHGPSVRFTVVSNPEFLREGKAVEDSTRPSRVLVGSDSPEGFEVMRELYATLIEKGTNVIETDLRTAELSKHASNAFLALKVSFANALARLCELTGADVVKIADVMGADPRIGRAHLQAGVGYGGYCFPKDLAAFEHLADKHGYEFPILAEIGRINEEAVASTFDKLEDILWNIDGKRVAILGLAFKPGTDDVRFAPALELARRLLEAGAVVVGYDPHANRNAKSELPELLINDNLYSALTGADCAVVCTEWDEIRALDIARTRQLMTTPMIVDGRNIFDPQSMAEEGFTYIPTGRPPVKPVEGSR